jgi:polar amino acid transport system permease protein
MTSWSPTTRTGRTDLPVLLAVRRPRPATVPHWLGARFGLALAIALIAAVGIGEAAAGPGDPSVIATLLKWTPLLAQGFGLNVLMSCLAMAAGTAAGTLLGLALISLRPGVRRSAGLATQIFRNAPWLVMLFYCMLLIPFEVRVGDTVVALPAWIKATFGLSLPVMANMAEIVRGAVLSIPFGQWESAESLAFTRRQTLWMIILPQCVKRMLPPWMNLYAILVVGTPLCSIVGVNEAMTLTSDALAAEARRELLIPMYLYLLLWFFLYCYPISRWTTALERRFAVDG